MKRIALTALALMALALLLPGSAYAQAARTWVSGVGDDANPCSRTAPCKTFAGAISKTAAGGEISVLDPGGFGAVTITKAITIDGGGGQVASIQVSGTNGIIVNAGVNDVVTIRNIRINGVGTGLNGINFIGGGALVVENCDIFSFAQWGINFVSPGNASHIAELYVSNTVLSNDGAGTTGGAILIQPPVVSPNAILKANITGVKAFNDAAGIKADGINSSLPTVVAVDHTQSAGSPHSGFVASGGNGNVAMMLNEVSSTNNNIGVQATLANATIEFGNSMVMGNATGVLAQSGGAVLSYKNNQINNNFTDGTPVPAVSGTGGLN